MVSNNIWNIPHRHQDTCFRRWRKHSSTKTSRTSQAFTGISTRKESPWYNIKSKRTLRKDNVYDIMTILKENIMVKNRGRTCQKRVRWKHLKSWHSVYSATRLWMLMHTRSCHSERRSLLAKKPAAGKKPTGKGYYLCHSISATRFPVSFLLPANSHGILWRADPRITNLWDLLFAGVKIKANDGFVSWGKLNDIVAFRYHATARFARLRAAVIPSAQYLSKRQGMTRESSKS